MVFPQEKWQLIWDADVITHSEEYIELPDPARDEARLSLWTMLLDNDVVAMDSVLNLKLPQPISSTFSNMQRTGKPVRIMTLKTNEAEYQVLQTVQVPHEKKEDASS